MAWTTPGTAVAGAVLEASFWNSNVRDNTLALYAQSQYPYRNLVYNGAMQVTQRGTSATSLTSGGIFTADRWALNNVTLGTWTQTVESDAPTGSGLRNSLKMLCTTADASPAASDELRISQFFEGYDVQRFAKGTTSAQQITVSFWVKANVTGTYICELYDTDNTRQVSRTYTVSASGTWEKKEITFPADTTGAFNNDNQLSFIVQFWLAAGSTFTSGTLNTSWASVTNANRVVGQTNLAAATNNYWQITGVQLEAGSVATPFEFLPFGDELARCQRYFCKTFDYGTTPASNAGQAGALFAAAPANTGVGLAYIVTWYFPVEMRAAPATVTTYNPTSVGSGWYDSAGASVAATTANAGTRGVLVYNNALATSGRNAGIHVTASAEL
jgi:hypothetical protein